MISLINPSGAPFQDTIVANDAKSAMADFALPGAVSNRLGVSSNLNF